MANEMKPCRTIPILLPVVFLSACGILIERSEPLTLPAPEPKLPPPEPVSFLVLHKADYNIDDSETFKHFAVLDNEASYRSELSRYSVEVPKAVDFSAQRVVLATMGTQPSGGFAIGVLSALDTSETVVVTLSLREPGPDCVHTAAASNPYEFALVDTIKPILFEEKVVTEKCQ